MNDATLKAKEAVVADIKDKFERSQSVVFLDYRGMTVAEVTELRNKLRAEGIEYKVIKNGLLKRAADQMEIKGLDEVLAGPTAVAFGFNDPAAPAKILDETVTKLKKTEIKGGLLNGNYISADDVKGLAKLPSKEELIAKMLGSMNAPIQGLVMALSGIPRNLVCALNAIKEKKEA